MAGKGDKSTPEWIRTTDLRIRSPLLYPAELRALVSSYDVSTAREVRLETRLARKGF